MSERAILAAAAATAIPQRRRKETEMRAEKMDLKCEESISNEAEMDKWFRPTFDSEAGPERKRVLAC